MEFTGTIKKVDVDNDEAFPLELAKGSDLNEFNFGEPQFVPKPNSSKEGEGCVLTPGNNCVTEESFLFVFDAQTMKERVRLFDALGPISFLVDKLPPPQQHRPILTPHAQTVACCVDGRDLLLGLVFGEGFYLADLGGIKLKF